MTVAATRLAMRTGKERSFFNMARD